MKTYMDFINESRPSKDVEILIKKYKKKATEDYQKRGGDYPNSGVPDSISVSGYQNEFNMTYSFKNTSENSAKKWVEKDLGPAAKNFKITSGQDGDYKDDWVIVYVEKSFA